MPFDTSPQTPWQIGRRKNTEALANFVSATISSGSQERMLRGAEHLRRQLRQLSAWAARDESEDDPCPAHLVGLQAFELSDAADKLEAAASKQRAA